MLAVLLVLFLAGAGMEAVSQSPAPLSHPEFQHWTPVEVVPNDR